MQAHYPNGSPYLNTRHAFASIYREGALGAGATATASATATTSASTAIEFPAVLAGVRSLWRGVSPTTIRGIILSTSQICSYDQIKQSVKLPPAGVDGEVRHVACCKHVRWASGGLWARGVVR